MYSHSRHKKAPKSAKRVSPDSPAEQITLLSSSPSYGRLTDVLRGVGPERMASSPGLIRRGEMSSTAAVTSEKASSRGSVDPLGLDPEDLMSDGGLDIVSVNSMVTDIMGDLADALTDARSRQLSSVLQKFYNSLSTQELFRRVMLDSIEWKLESCLSVLVPIVANGRAHRSGSAFVDALRAARCILLLFTCQYRSHILEAVSGTCLEQIATACVLGVPRVYASMEAIGSTTSGGGLAPASVEISGGKKMFQVGNSHLIWTIFAILGEMIRGNLIDDNLPEELTRSIFSDDESSSVPVYFSWKDWISLHTRSFLRRKQNQLHGARQSGTAIQWTAEEVLYVDGLCLCLSSWLCSQSRAILYNRQETSHFGFIWKFVNGFSYIMAESPIDFVNTYVDAMPAEVLKPKSSSICLGLPSLIGICYEAWWGGQTRSKNSEAEPMPESDVKLLSVLRVFAGAAGSLGAKSLSKNLTKEVSKIFRDLEDTVELGDVPATISVRVGKSDVQESSGGIQIATKNSLGASLIGECLLVSTWQQQYILRICREFAGIHSTLAFVIQMDQTGDATIFQGLNLEERTDRAARHEISRKFRQMERSWKQDLKRSQRQVGFADDE